MFSKKNDYSSLVMVDFGLATSELLDKYIFIFYIDFYFQNVEHLAMLHQKYYHYYQIINIQQKLICLVVVAYFINF